MNDRSDSDDVVLSPHERLALRRMEAELSGDRRLTRRMRRHLHRHLHPRADRPHLHPRADRPYPHPRADRPVSGRWLPLSTAALLSACVFLVVMGVRTSAPAPLWCFAALWPLTLFQAFRLLRRAPGAGSRPEPRPGEHGTPWR